MLNAFQRALAGIWAGTVVGGSLIAAPAKFTVDSLSLPLALEVGRAQFFWLGFGEAFLCACLLVCALFSSRARHRILVLPIVVFAVQRLYLMPMLNARTNEIIAGVAVPPSSLHLVYVALEIIKIALLCLFAMGGLNNTRGQNHVSQS